MKKYIIGLFVVFIMIANTVQAQTNYQDFYRNWYFTKFMPTSLSGGGSLTVEVKNNVLTVNFSAGFSACALKTGTIEYLETVPRLPDIHLGTIAGSYVAYIKDGALWISSTQKESLTGVSKKFTVDLTAMGGFPAVALSDEYNYIYSVSPLKAASSLDGLASGEVAKEVQYFDGLGRLSQSTQIQISPDGKDIIQPVKYDDYGRVAQEYLPFADSKNGTYHSAAFASSNWVEHYGSEAPNAFSLKKFDDSPLKRVLEQGAPGSAWQPKPGATDYSGHTIKIVYATNHAIEVLCFIIENDALKLKSGGEYYNANQLYKTITKDENWIDQSTDELDKLHTTEEFKDKFGRVVLKRSYVEDGLDTDSELDVLDTYYVYDDYDLLRYVIPPKAVEVYKNGGSSHYTPDAGYKVIESNQSLSAVESGTDKYFIKHGASLTLLPGYNFKATSSQSLLIKAEELNLEEFNELIYAYKYDERKRMIEKKLPGARPVYMLYDNCDRLVLTQDGNQREDDNWMYTMYDVLNRPIETGLINTLATFESLKQTVGNSNNYVPSGRTAYTYTWYDDYKQSAPYIGIDNNNVISEYLASDGKKYMEEVKGLVTCTQEKVFGADEGSWLTTTNYYDKKYRVIQTQQKLVLKEGATTTTFTDCISSKYDFVGKVERLVQVHSSDKISVHQTIDQEFKYDHAGRLLEVAQTLSGAINKAKTVISTMSYDELGQLKSKSYHGGQQPLNYTYNIRGWMESINDPNNMGNSMFAMKLLYNNTSEITGVDNHEQYNGNIGGILWRSKNTSGTLSSLRAYGYTYDALNRVKTADYEEKSSSWTNNTKFDVTGNDSGISYDLNGNIENLKRYDSGTGTKDHFNYRYAGNQLIALGENGAAAPSGNEFSYDANGNMIANSNKGISNLEYNSLNLPESMTVNAKTVEYNYTASGQKIKNHVAGKDLYYIGNFVYENSSLKYMLHNEGRILVNGSTATYEYHLKDHLGNTRVAFQENQSNPIQSTDYYPFGLTMNMSDGSTNEYLYNGKELQEETDWLDYGARMYDAQLGRWHCVDPLAESYYAQSSYHFSGNNPMRFIDQNGMSYGDFVDENGKEIGNDGKADNKVYVVKSTESGISKSDIKATKKFIENNSGNTAAFDNNSIAYDNSVEIEGSSKTRQDMVNTTSGDNGKGGTSSGNNREYGGTIDNNGNVTAATPGPVADPSKSAYASVSITTTSQTKSTFHSHPSGTVVVTSRGGNSSATSSSSTIGGGSTTTYGFTQTPSKTDINNTSSGRTNYVFGKGNGTVYIYNSSGIQAKIPEKRFVNFKK